MKLGFGNRDSRLPPWRSRHTLLWAVGTVDLALMLLAILP
jgi:hypothetical protein